MDEQHHNDPAPGLPCPCRPWLERELGRVRAEIANDLRTRRLQVGLDTEPHVVIEAGIAAASVEVRDGSGGVTVELTVTAGHEGTFAALSLSCRGDTLATMLVTDPSDHTRALCRLVFDAPRSRRPWLVIDRDGLRLES